MLLVIKVTGDPKWIWVHDGVRGTTILDEIIDPAEYSEDVAKLPLNIATRDGFGDVTVKVGRRRGKVAKTFRNRELETECHLLLSDDVIEEDEPHVGPLEECSWEEPT